MKFFDEGENRIEYEEWLPNYERYYFLGGPTLDRRITRRNQSSRFVENQACALLSKTTPLSSQDLVLLMAWKIGGLIDHGLSEATQKIAYLQNWPVTLAAATQYGKCDFSGSIPVLAAKMPTISAEVNRGNPRYLFELTPHLQGFGAVYILTVLFFVSHGRYPIYDKYADVAAQAIAEDLPPTSHIPYNGIQKWSDYERYIRRLEPIQSVGARSWGDSMFISRAVDRGLWVYGHFFETESGTSASRTLAPISSTIKVISSAGGVLTGRICDLSSSTSDGWRRRELNVKQGREGYPAVRDVIHLIDSSGTRYPSLPFVKGARLPGHTCLGQPGALKPWFLKHYSSHSVASESVYLTPTGGQNEYRIYTESEWAKSSGT